MKKNQILGTSTRKDKRLGKTLLDTEPPLDKNKPTGPFRTAAVAHMGDLLIFVPRNEISRTINDLTGRYGY